MLLRELDSDSNPEFKKVIKILQSDAELSPLILEHELMLRTLKDMTKLKAE
jgi:hypothetical protein